MNYRHAFHAGNFADLLKHAVLGELLSAALASPAPLTVIDTHAGAGLYDLAGAEARRSGETEAGIARLMADPAAPAPFAALKAAVRRANTGAVRWYPGSPLLIADALRARDRLIGCELRHDDHAALKAALPRQLGALVLREDGWAVVAARTPPAPAAVLVLIDPPFERPDDGASAASAIGAVLARNPAAVIAVWAPIKDLAGFDALQSACEDAARGRPMLVAQVRLRPLADPMRLNGCAMIVVNPPLSLAAPARMAADWIVAAVGEAGGEARVEAQAP